MQHTPPPTKMATPPPPRAVAISHSDLTNLVNSSVAAGLSAFTQAQASVADKDATSSVPGIAALDSVDVVGIKLGTFWTDRPAVWFAQAEAQFKIKKITVESTMFHHVLVALDNKTSGEVEHVIMDPPEDNPYSALKDALLEAYERTPAQKDREFMTIRSLGDLTPSAMLRKMRRLRPKSEHDSTIFRWSFLRVLPLEVSNILLVMEDEPLDTLAKKADRILDQRNDAPGSVAAITGTSSPPSSSLGLLSIGECDAVRRMLRGDGRGQRNNDERPNPRGTDSAPFTCKNHAKWGTKSFSCRPGCLFADLPLARKPGNANAGR